MKEGSSFGWYLPISSSTRPSRFLRESTTTMRYCGTRILPRRFKRILTATFVVSPQKLSWVRDRSPGGVTGSGHSIGHCVARMRGSGRAGHEERFCQTVGVSRQSGASRRPLRGSGGGIQPDERAHRRQPRTPRAGRHRGRSLGRQERPWLSASSPSRRLSRRTRWAGSRPCGRRRARPGCRGTPPR